MGEIYKLVGPLLGYVHECIRGYIGRHICICIYIYTLICWQFMGSTGDLQRLGFPRVGGPPICGSLTMATLYRYTHIRAATTKGLAQPC